MAARVQKIQDYKIAAVGELKDSFQDVSDFIFADYRGLSVGQISELRKKLREKEATFKVVRNSFARLAFKDLDKESVSDYLVGPTAVAISPKDSNEVAKILFDFVKEAPTLKVKGALVSGTIYDSAQVEEFSKLPGRLDLISMLMSAMNGAIRNCAMALNDINTRLVRVVKAVADQKGGEA